MYKLCTFRLFSLKLSQFLSSSPLFPLSWAYYGEFLLVRAIQAVYIARIIGRELPDIIHLNNGIGENLAALFASIFCGVPCLSHIRGTTGLRKLERIFGGAAEKLITLNKKMYELYVNAFGNDKVCTILNGVDLDSFEHNDGKKLRDLYKLGEDSLLVGTVARLIPGKGIPEFISAAAKVKESLPNTYFVVIGDDPLLDGRFEDEMKRLARNLGLKDNIIFTGWRYDVTDVMCGLDLVVQVSTYPEGMSLTPIEAMALGKPVITSDVPGYTDTVEHGITGLMVPAGDVSALIKAILTLATDKELSRRMGNAGRRKVVQEFDIKHTVNKVQAVYEQILCTT